jgi:hypothetical protein
MLGILRQFARALTGKVDALEFSLGILFGILLGLIPSGAVDPGTGLLGLNGLWLAIMFVMLLLRASLPIALLFLGFSKLLGILFLDQVGFSIGQTLLDGALPQGVVEGLALSLPSWQLHTYWGMGATALAVIVAVPTFLASFLVMRTKLPTWREKFGQSRLARVLGGFFLFRLIGRLLA